jgi:hypothetical protein
VRTFVLLLLWFFLQGGARSVLQILTEILQGLRVFMSEHLSGMWPRWVLHVSGHMFDVSLNLQLSGKEGVQPLLCMLRDAV